MSLRCRVEFQRNSTGAIPLELHPTSERRAMHIRADLAEAQRTAWEKIGTAGTWWTGAERVAIAAETRHALRCPLCAARKDAVSPAMVGGDHATLGALPGAAVEAIHRIRTDPGRIGEGWYRRVLAQ